MTREMTMTDGRKYDFTHTCTMEGDDGDEMSLKCHFEMDGPDRNAAADLIHVIIDGQWVPPETVGFGIRWQAERQAEVAWENGGYSDAARYEKELGA